MQLPAGIRRPTHCHADLQAPRIAVSMAGPPPARQGSGERAAPLAGPPAQRLASLLGCSSGGSEAQARGDAPRPPGSAAAAAAARGCRPPPAALNRRPTNSLNSYVQDLVACVLLSEAIYKAAEGPPSAAAAALLALRAAFPPGAARLAELQFSRRSAPHRYCLARGPDALYVAFMGTKHPRDVLADANLLATLLWDQAPAAAAAASAAAAAAEGATAAAATDAPATTAAAAAVHRGFLGRAQGLPVEALWAHARSLSLRVVLCGHSLGGAVAQLCALRLLHALRAAPPPPDALRCIVLGAPAIGNAALGRHVEEAGWAARFVSVALPGKLSCTAPSHAAPQPVCCTAACRRVPCPTPPPPRMQRTPCPACCSSSCLARKQRRPRRCRPGAMRQQRLTPQQ